MRYIRTFESFLDDESKDSKKAEIQEQVKTKINEAKDEYNDKDEHIDYLAETLFNENDEVGYTLDDYKEWIAEVYDSNEE